MTDSDAADLVSESGARYSSAIFHNAGIYQKERENIFGRYWNFVADESQIPNEGDFFLSRIGEESVIVTRGASGRVNVMLNVCRHRGHVICRAETGNSKRFVCPFHAWTYDPDGELIHAPMTQELAPDFDKSEFGLVHVPRVETYRGLIFANFDKSAPPLQEELGREFLFYLDTFLHRRNAELVMIGGVQKWEAESNWKIGPDGMGGDFYHVAGAHASTFAADPVLREEIAAMGDPRVATQVPLSGVLDELSKLFAFARETLTGFLELVSLEARRAALSLVWMIVGGLVASIFIVTAWAGLMAALAMYIVSLGMLPLAAVIVVAAVNLISGAGMLYWCIALSRHLLFSATRRQLAGAALVRPAAP